MNALSEAVLALHDSGQHAEQIANALDVPRGRVYAVLREHRPDRERKPRRRVSGLPAQIYFKRTVEGVKPCQIAKALQVSRQYVHKVLNEPG